MRIKLGYSMGYTSTDTAWTEDIPADVVEEGSEAIEDYLDSVRDSLYREASEKISVWAEIEE